MNKKFVAAVCGLVCWAMAGAKADGIDKNTAKMQAMDKITGRVSVINVPVGGMVQFGSLSIVVRACKTRPMEETPDNFAFADIADKTLKGEDVNIVRGWMISSSPATHAVEHPIYDVWLLSCIDKKVDKKLLLSEEQLAAHESILPADAKEGANTDTVENYNVEPISEMQEDTTRRQSELEPTIEFSYDEADESEEEAESEEDGVAEDLPEENAADSAEM